MNQNFRPDGPTDSACGAVSVALSGLVASVLRIHGLRAPLRVALAPGYLIAAPSALLAQLRRYLIAAPSALHARVLATLLPRLRRSVLARLPTIERRMMQN
jgi:hypothetical protein